MKTLAQAALAFWLVASSGGLAAADSVLLPQFDATVRMTGTLVALGIARSIYDRQRCRRLLTSDTLTPEASPCMTLPSRTCRPAEVLEQILQTRISPELIPTTADTSPTQSAEETVGPYALQDFNLYYLSRFGYRPSKVAYLAYQAWGQRDRGAWPDSIPVEERREYDLPTIKKWLSIFLQRFFESSQFKRSALPNGPKVGSGGSLSPRGDWRAPSDTSARAWLDELSRNVP